LQWVLASDIARRLVDLREVMGWTQPELGRQVRRGYRQVLAWEKGKVEPPKRVLEELADSHRWPLAIFSEGGPMPSDVLTPPGQPTPQAVFGLELGKIRSEVDNYERARELIPPKLIRVWLDNLEHARISAAESQRDDAPGKPVRGGERT